MSERDDDSTPYVPEKKGGRGKRNGADTAVDAAPAGSDEALALELAERHGDRLRYVHEERQWWLDSGPVWRCEKMLQQIDFARVLARDVAATSSGKTALDLASWRKISAVLQLARADRRIAASLDQWDKDPWLLGTPAGVVDLRSGDMRATAREDYLTRLTTIAPGGGCPLWDKFLNRVTDGDAELRLYLQRVAGYCLTGITREHVLIFLYGTGANGKSVFVETLAWVMGDYATVAPIETFTEVRGERHPTELAGLRGARLVSATETDDGRAWAESRIKALTGGDRVTARFMRGDFFEYTPQFKLVISGNHQPRLRNVDEAMRRRLHLVPFAVTIPVDERDDGLAEKLRAEGGGILAWMIEGALEWGGGGLQPPEAVRMATDDYLDAEDSLGRWLDEKVLADPQATTETAALFRSWASWADANRERAGSIRRFSQALQSRGWAPVRLLGGVRGFAGLVLPGRPEPGAGGE